MSDSKASVVDRNAADTNGWNTVFAIDFTHANQAIAANWPNIGDKAKKISVASTDPELGTVYQLDGAFNPWQLEIGGDGKNVRMTCPFKSGSYTVNTTTFDLAPAGKAPATVLIEVGMEWVPDPDQQAFVLDSSSPAFATIKADLDNNTADGPLVQAFQKHGITLDPSAIKSPLVVTPGKEWHLASGTGGSHSYYVFHTQDKSGNEFLTVYQFQDSWAVNLKLLAAAVSSDQPAVIIETIANNPISTEHKAALAALPQLLSDWFNDNVAEFNHVFAILDLVPQLDTDQAYAWTKPAGTSYAVTDNGTMDSSVFGVLTATVGNTGQTSHQVSPYAIPQGDDAKGANAGFLISGPDFVKHMLLPAAQTTFNNASADNFEIINDHLTVQNLNELVWGKFMMDEKKQVSVPEGDNYVGDLDAGNYPPELQEELEGLIFPPSDATVTVTTKGEQWLLSNGQDSSNESILDLMVSTLDVYEATIIKVDPGFFKMSLVHSRVEIQFLKVKYSYSSDFDVHVDYTEQVTLTLQNKTGTDGKTYQIFWFDQFFKNMVVSVTKTQAAITRAIVEGAVTAVLSLIAVAGPVIQGLTAGAEISEAGADTTEAVIDAEAFAEAEEANPEEFEEAEEAAAKTTAEQSGGKLANIKAAFETPKWKMVGTIAGVAGAVVGVDQALQAIVEAVANNQWEKVPGFDKFANQLVAPYTFPGITGFELTSAWLADSLQIGMKTK